MAVGRDLIKVINEPLRFVFNLNKKIHMERNLNMFSLYLFYFLIGGCTALLFRWLFDDRKNWD